MVVVSSLLGAAVVVTAVVAEAAVTLVATAMAAVVAAALTEQSSPTAAANTLEILPMRTIPATPDKAVSALLMDRMASQSCYGFLPICLRQRW